MSWLNSSANNNHTRILVQQELSSTMIHSLHWLVWCLLIDYSEDWSCKVLVNFQIYMFLHTQASDWRLICFYNLWFYMAPCNLDRTNLNILDFSWFSLQIFDTIWFSSLPMSPFQVYLKHCHNFGIFLQVWHKRLTSGLFLSA